MSSIGRTVVSPLRRYDATHTATGRVGAQPRLRAISHQLTASIVRLGIGPAAVHTATFTTAETDRVVPEDSPAEAPSKESPFLCRDCRIRAQRLPGSFGNMSVTVREVANA